MAKMKHDWARWRSLIGAVIFFTTAGPAIAREASANEVVTAAQAATGGAGVLDLKTAPELPNPPPPEINPDRMLHNNISMTDHLAAKKKASGDLSRAKHRPNVH
jgi:hypothetical protein